MISAGLLGAIYFQPDLVAYLSLTISLILFVSSAFRLGIM